MASLFGPTPAEIMMARQKEQQQLNMMRQQQISQEGGQFGVFAPLYQAGLRFGDVGAQAMRQRMFPEQVDPMLQKATAIQGVLAKYQGQDLNSAETMTSIAKELSMIDPEAGLRAGEIARKLVKEGGKITLGAELLDQINPEDRARVIDEYQRTGRLPSDTTWSVGGSKPIAPGQEIARAAGALGIEIPGDIREFTTEQWQALDAKMNEEKVKQAAASAARLNFEDPKGKFAAITEVNSQVRPLVQQVNNLDQAISLRLRNNSPFSQRLFEQTVAGAFGDAQKASTEITRLVNSGTLGQRVENTLSLFLQGKIGNATKEDQIESLTFMRDYLAEQYDTTVQPYRAAAGDKANEIAPTAADRFKRPKLPPGKQYVPARIVQQYGLTKGQQFRTNGKLMIYNGDGTVSEVKGQ
jgi:hypothetical protein